MGSTDLERRSAEDPEPRSSGQAASPRQLARIVGAAVGGALAVVTLGLVLALWGLGLTGKISQSTSEVLDLVKLGFALVAGVGGTVGLVLAYQRHLIAVETGQRERAKEAREDAKLFNERFGTAASQLASEQYAVKLAGAYAMAKLADDWDTGRQTCINVLCANLRRGYTPKPPDDADPPDLLAFNDNQEFRHTIIAVISTRLREPASPWHGCIFDFHDAVFDGGNFTGANFSGGFVDFRGATFSGGFVNFRDTTFSGGTVDFTGVIFDSGYVTFDSAAFTGGTVTFRNAAFGGDRVGFERAAFSGGAVGFDNAGFVGADVSFVDATFSGGTMNLAGVKFFGSNVDFHRATFSGGAVGFDNAEFSDGTVSFELARFSGSPVSFDNVEFSGGTVNFAQVSDFSVPPRFDFPLETVPTGVLLPAGPDSVGTQ